MSKRLRKEKARVVPTHGKYVACLGCGKRAWWPEPGHIHPSRLGKCYKCGGIKWQQ